MRHEPPDEVGAGATSGEEEEPRRRGHVAGSARSAAVDGAAAASAGAVSDGDKADAADADNEEEHSAPGPRMDQSALDLSATLTGNPNRALGSATDGASGGASDDGAARPPLLRLLFLFALQRAAIGRVFSGETASPMSEATKRAQVARRKQQGGERQAALKAQSREARIERAVTRRRAAAAASAEEDPREEIAAEMASSARVTTADGAGDAESSQSAGPGPGAD
jgi:hypothetical protein